ncbi:MAG: phosphatase PAP2 family protein [Methylobacillus sp.]|nr:phosphatase PAP2 family protein [Methylobacillus sp.]
MRMWLELALPLLLSFPSLMLLQHYGWDIIISRWFFDAATGYFPLSDNWWFKHMLHDDVRRFAVALLCMLLIAVVSSHVCRSIFPYRRMLWQLLAAVALSALVIFLIKRLSYPACPYELQLFGRDQAMVGIFDMIPAGYKPGHCWPGGHGSIAFSLFALYFAARDASRKRLALGLLAFVLLFGLALSVAQVARGMHFVSHQIWTALICWYLTWLLYQIFNCWYRAARAPIVHAHG